MAFEEPGPEKSDTDEALPFGFDDYVALLRGTEIAIRLGGTKLPEESTGLPERLGLVPENWVKTITTSHRRFFAMVGRVHRIALQCARMGCRQAKGSSWAAGASRRAA